MPEGGAANDEQRAAEIAARFVELRRTGDRNLRNRLIEDHRWVAVHCARRFANRGEPVDDLIQVGQVGLLKAVERFDPEIGVSFASYAIPTVMGELRRHFRDATWAVKVPRRLKDMHVDLGNAVEFLSSELGRPPNPQEVAGHLGVRVDDVLEAMDAGGAYRTTPLSPAPDDGGERRESPALRSDDVDLAGADDRVLIGQLLEGLPERERTIVELRFWSGLSQSEIAEQVGVSQVHVSRLLRSSLMALQRSMGNREAG